MRHIPANKHNPNSRLAHSLEAILRYLTNTSLEGSSELEELYDELKPHIDALQRRTRWHADASSDAATDSTVEQPQLESRRKLSQSTRKRP